MLDVLWCVIDEIFYYNKYSLSIEFVGITLLHYLFGYFLFHPATVEGTAEGKGA